MKKWLSSFYSRYPGLILGGTGLFCLTSTILTFSLTDFPDFSDPSAGFITRNTEISNRFEAFQLLEREIRDVRDPLLVRFPHKTRTSRVRRRPIVQNTTSSKAFINSELSRFIKNKKRTRRPKFCPWLPNEQYIQLVFEVGDFGAVETIRGLCEVEEKLWKLGYFSDTEVCQRYSAHRSKGDMRKKRCCQPGHLGSAIAAMAGEKSCRNLNETHIARVWKERILRCASKSAKAIDSWDETPDSDALGRFLPSDECLGSDMATTFKYFLPKTFLSWNETTEQYPRNHTVFFLPITKSFALRDSSTESPKIFSHSKLQHLVSHLNGEHVKLVGLDAGLRTQFFEYHLFQDTIYCTIAAGIVVLLIWVYTGTFIFTLASILSIVLSAGAAYFVYRVVLGIQFFPFINLLTFVLLIGVGADDAFILRRTWLCAKKDKNAVTLEKIVTKTLEHACLGMGVTSLTTATAFFANLVSNIVVIKCFGIFAGTAILMHYLLVVTWLPAALIIQEKYDRPSECSPVRHCGKSKETTNSDGTDAELTDSGSQQQQSPCKLKVKTFIRVLRDAIKTICIPWSLGHEFFSDMGRTFFEKILPCVVIKFRVVWFLLFCGLFGSSSYIFFKAPGLKLPQKDYFQFFRSSHVFERFENELRHEFKYKEEYKTTLDIRVVWGVTPRNKVGTFEPEDEGNLELEESRNVDFGSNVAVLWLLEFCNDFAKANFTDFTPPMLPYCYVHDFMTTLAATPCSTKVPIRKRTNHAPCCRDNRFPYPSGMYDQCVARYMLDEIDTIRRYDMETSLFTGPLFLSDSAESQGNNNNSSHTVPRIGATTIGFISTFNATLIYEDMDRFYRLVQPWIQERLDAAPASMRKGWFTSIWGGALRFYDLQSALLRGTRIAVPIAIAVAFFFIFLCTRNLWIGLLATTVIAGVIIGTGAALILSGWELNILESTVICLTIGLSFDFTLHYAVAYSKLCPDSESEARVVFAISRVGSPIFMSCLTTMIPGFVMLFATTLAYSQIGYFMLLISAISYIYSTFFFTSLLHMFGPSGRNCEITGASCKECCTKKPQSLPSSSFSRRVSKAETVIRRPSAPSMIRDQRSDSQVEITYDVQELQPMMSPALRAAANRARFSDKRPSLRERAMASIRRRSAPTSMASNSRRSSMADRSFVVPRSGGGRNSTSTDRELDSPQKLGKKSSQSSIKVLVNPPHIEEDSEISNSLTSPGSEDASRDPNTVMTSLIEERSNEDDSKTNSSHDED